MIKPRTALLTGVTAASVAAALLIPRMPQPVGYHDFADHRALLGIENFLDVASNLGFLVAGLAGLFVVLHRNTAFEHPAERWPYAVFFVGMLLTAAGSAYYHLAPDNETLFWDRLPMTVAFGALIAAQIVDRIERRAGLMLLLPMLLLGAASVLYWRMTERAGAGNVIPYAIVQGYAVLMLLLITMAFPSRYTHGRDLYWVFVAYMAAKLFEALDRPLLMLSEIVSGHSLKHLAAAAAGLIVARMLWLRSPQGDVTPPPAGWTL